MLSWNTYGFSYPVGDVLDQGPAVFLAHVVDEHTHRRLRSGQSLAVVIFAGTQGSEEQLRSAIE